MTKVEFIQWKFRRAKFYWRWYVVHFFERVYVNISLFFRARVSDYHAILAKHYYKLAIKEAASRGYAYHLGAAIKYWPLYLKHINQSGGRCRFRLRNIFKIK